jgi:hypothetical protein
LTKQLSFQTIRDGSKCYLEPALSRTAFAHAVGWMSHSHTHRDDSSFLIPTGARNTTEQLPEMANGIDGHHLIWSEGALFQCVFIEWTRFA